MPRPARMDPKLSPEVILATARAMIERDGVEAFSMRGLARELDVQPAAVYWHVSDRETLLGEVAESVLGEVRVPDDRLPWDAWFAEYARSYRRTLHANPRLVPLINSNLASNTVERLELVEGFLSHLERAGFHGGRLVDAYNVAIGAIVGFVGLELAPAPVAEDHTWSDPLQEELEDVDTSRFPSLARNRDLLVNRAFVTRWVSGDEAPLDGAFEALLRVIVSGLEALR